MTIEELILAFEGFRKDKEVLVEIFDKNGYIYPDRIARVAVNLNGDLVLELESYSIPF